MGNFAVGWVKRANNMATNKFQHCFAKFDSWNGSGKWLRIDYEFCTGWLDWTVLKYWSGARPLGLYSSPLQWRSGLWMLVCLLVSQLKIWRTALTIFLIFCMNVPYYKTKKRTGPFFREKSGSLIIHENSFWPFSPLWWLGSTLYRIWW